MIDAAGAAVTKEKITGCAKAERRIRGANVRMEVTYCPKFGAVAESIKTASGTQNFRLFMVAGKPSLLDSASNELPALRSVAANNDSGRLKTCNSREELINHLNAEDQTFCVHTVGDVSKNIISGEPIDKNKQLSRGLKIALVMDIVSWRTAMASYEKLAGGHWIAPESEEYPATPTASDPSKSLQRIGKYLSGKGNGFFWSSSTNSLYDGQAWVLYLGPGSTHYAIDKSNPRYDGHGISVFCVQ